MPQATIHDDDIPEAPVNKLWLTKEQQDMIARVLTLATFSANIVTSLSTPYTTPEQMQEDFMEMNLMVKANYSGTLSLLADLKEIARILDLPTAFYVKKDGQSL